MKESLGGVTHVGVSRGVTGWCHMKESLGGVTHLGMSREGFTWWKHGVVSHIRWSHLVE
jgi:hypothetical protein